MTTATRESRISTIRSTEDVAHPMLRDLYMRWRRRCGEDGSLPQKGALSPDDLHRHKATLALSIPNDTGRLTFQGAGVRVRDLIESMTAGASVLTGSGGNDLGGRLVKTMEEGAGAVLVDYALPRPTGAGLPVRALVLPFAVGTVSPGLLMHSIYPAV